MDYKIAPSACVLLFGVRFLSAEKFDKENDPRARTAREHGLDVETGRRYPPSAEHPFFLLIGKRLHKVAHDGSCERSAKLAEVRKALKTAEKLAEAGFTEVPELWVQCKFD